MSDVFRATNFRTEDASQLLQPPPSPTAKWSTQAIQLGASFVPLASIQVGTHAPKSQGFVMAIMCKLEHVLPVFMGLLCRTGSVKTPIVEATTSTTLEYVSAASILTPSTKMESANSTTPIAPSFWEIDVIAVEMVTTLIFKEGAPSCLPTASSPTSRLEAVFNATKASLCLETPV